MINDKSPLAHQLQLMTEISHLLNAGLEMLQCLLNRDSPRDREFWEQLTNSQTNLDAIQSSLSPSKVDGSKQPRQKSLSTFMEEINSVVNAIAYVTQSLYQPQLTEEQDPSYRCRAMPEELEFIIALFSPGIIGSCTVDMGFIFMPARKTTASYLEERSFKDEITDSLSRLSQYYTLITKNIYYTHVAMQLRVNMIQLSTASNLYIEKLDHDNPSHEEQFIGKGEYGEVKAITAVGKHSSRSMPCPKLRLAEKTAHRFDDIPAMFQEAEMLKKLQTHDQLKPYIPAYFGCTINPAAAPPTSSLYMTLLPSTTLLTEMGYLTQPEKLFVGYQLLVAIKALHDQHIYHQDLKPANIILDRSSGAPQIKIVDWGAASRTDSAQVRNVLLTTTHAYAPPCALLASDDNGMMAYDPQLVSTIDHFSVGIILLELYQLERMETFTPWTYRLLEAGTTDKTPLHDNLYRLLFLCLPTPDRKLKKGEIISPDGKTAKRIIDVNLKKKEITTESISINKYGYRRQYTHNISDLHASLRGIIPLSPAHVKTNGRLLPRIRTALRKLEVISLLYEKCNTEDSKPSLSRCCNALRNKYFYSNDEHPDSDHDDDPFFEPRTMVEPKPTLEKMVIMNPKLDSIISELIRIGGQPDLTALANKMAKLALPAYIRATKDLVYMSQKPSSSPDTVTAALC